MASTVEQVRPVLRPLFATAVEPGVMEATGRIVLAGAPSSGTPFVEPAPSSMMLPLVSTVPETTLAMAASTGGAQLFTQPAGCSRVTNCDRFPTVVLPEPATHGLGVSISPG